MTHLERAIRLALDLSHTATGLHHPDATKAQLETAHEYLAAAAGIVARLIDREVARGPKD